MARKGSVNLNYKPFYCSSPDLKEARNMVKEKMKGHSSVDWIGYQT